MERKTGHHYIKYSVAWFVAWIIVFGIEILFHIKRPSHYVFFIFLGWLIGWISVTIFIKVNKNKI